MVSHCEDPLDEGDDGYDTVIPKSRSPERTENEEEEEESLSQASSTASGKRRIEEATKRAKV